MMKDQEMGDYKVGIKATIESIIGKPSKYTLKTENYCSGNENLTKNCHTLLEKIVSLKQIEKLLNHH